MRSVYLFVVSVHVLAAIFWIGGALFLAFVGAPVLRRVDPPALRAELFRQLGERFRVAGWAAILVLLATGSLILHLRGLLQWAILSDALFWSTDFGRALGWKLAAVATMIVASGLHDFLVGPLASRLAPTSARAARLRRFAMYSARASALLAIVLVVAAVRLARGG